MKYTMLGKIKGKKFCNYNNNKVKIRLNKILQSIITRCYNPKHKCYKNYGGKGITICDEWICEKGLDNFYEWAINNGYYYEKEDCGYSKLSIDRIDNNKGYSPDNCRWATRTQQARNKSNTIIVEYNGRKAPLRDFCDELNLKFHAIFLRIYRRGWSVEKALSTPIKEDYDLIYNGEHYTMKSLALKFGLEATSLKYRLLNKGETIEQALTHFKVI